MGSATIAVDGGTSKLVVRTVDTTDPPFSLPYTGAETLACAVWPGGSLATLAAPTAAWVVPATPTLSIALTPLDVAALPPGVYQFRVVATRAGVTGTVDRGTVEVLPAPSTGALQLAFTTAADLLFYAPWVEDLESWNDLFGFNAQQVRATNGLIADLVGLAKPFGLGVMPFSPDGTTYFMPGYSSDAPSRWLREQIVPVLPGTAVPITGMVYRRNTTANYIDSTLSTALLLYPEVKEVCAKRALGYVFKAQVGANTERAWKELSLEFAADARRVFLSTRFQLDYGNPQTGNGYSIIDGGNSSFR